MGTPPQRPPRRDHDHKRKGGWPEAIGLVEVEEAQRPAGQALLARKEQQPESMGKSGGPKSQEGPWTCVCPESKANSPQLSPHLPLCPSVCDPRGAYTAILNRGRRSAESLELQPVIALPWRCHSRPDQTFSSPGETTEPTVPKRMPEMREGAEPI